MGTQVMIQFAWPYLFLLVPFPWLIYRFFPASRWNENSPIRVADLRDFDCLQSSTSTTFFKLNALLPFFIWIALVAAAARPQWVGNAVEVPQSGRDLMLAVDLSGSMQLQDFEVKGRRVDRLSALKWIAGDFIDRRKGDRIGLILFGSNAYLQTPLTFDLATVKQLLNEAAVGLAGKETAIGDAIGLAVKQMQHSPQASRVLILLTDGNSNAGELAPEKAAEIAARAQLRIHTVAIGSKEAVVQTPFGLQRIHPSAGLDEKSLQMVAEKTGGEYFRAYNTEDLSRIYEHINRLEVIERDVHFFRPIDELYPWPLLFALICTSIWLVSHRWARR